MRHFGTVKPTFWVGQTGRQLRALGGDAQLLGVYLLTNPHANMLGLYYLPLVLIRQEISVSMASILKTLVKFEEIGFAAYDVDAEMVWIVEMLRFQVGDAPKTGDNRFKAVVRMYAQTPANRFLGSFFDRYTEMFGMADRREGSPLEAPSKPPVITSVKPRGPVPVPDRGLDPVLEKKQCEDFDNFWAAYPRKDGKKLAREEWTRIAPDDETQQAMAADLETRKVSAQWLKESGQYIPHAKTYLHQRRWEDGFSEAPRLSERTVNVLKGWQDPNQAKESA